MFGGPSHHTNQLNAELLALFGVMAVSLLLCVLLAAAGVYCRRCRKFDPKTDGGWHQQLSTVEDPLAEATDGQMSHGEMPRI